MMAIVHLQPFGMTIFSYRTLSKHRPPGGL